MCPKTPRPPTPDAVGPLRLDAGRRTHLAEMLSFIASIHHHIDPDRFDIDAAQVEHLRQVLEADDGLMETTLIVSFDDLLALETIADAAGTYSLRKDSPGMNGTDADDCAAFADWVARAGQELFNRPARVH